ncbi:hypothetical protein XENOCAPTIV_014440 [Xenoophorus captivus]|uniref:Uncharacterized protein n=1 Tax=Xenoophorus captivus TaxID=1517983 RepID=A0ABV0SBI2_9TELE
MADSDIQYLTFLESHYKLLETVCWMFGPFLLTELVEMSQVCRPGLGSSSIWKTHFCPSFNFLVDIFRCCFNISTYSSFPHFAICFVNCTGFSKSQTQHDAATPIPHSWDVCFRHTSFTHFPPNLIVVIMARHFSP